MANVLIVHQNFPGQFANIAKALQSRGDRVFALGATQAKGITGVPIGRWAAKRGSTPGIFEPATRAEADILRGHHALRVALEINQRGFRPDIIIGHPGWGETLFLKQIWPNARSILLGEYICPTSGGDSGFDPEFDPPSLLCGARAHAKNATQVLAYAYADLIICPTDFQASTFPPSLQRLIRIFHEGIDVGTTGRRPKARVRLASGRTLTGTVPIITFVSRTLEPLRGLHIFLRALPAFLEACPTAEVVIVGDEQGAGYGKPAPEKGTWMKTFLEELGNRLDQSRVHLMGRMEHSKLIDLFSISKAHVYYTYPFVLSWSLLEAMACKCLVIASDTAPVRDAIRDGEEGVLLPFFDVPALSAALVEAVQKPRPFDRLRRQARARVVTHFNSKNGVKLWLSAIDELLGRNRE